MLVRYYRKTSVNWTIEGYFNYMFGSDVILPDTLVLGSMINHNGDLLMKMDSKLQSIWKEDIGVLVLVLEKLFQ